MAINVGEKLPEATFHVLENEGMKEYSTQDLFAGKTVALFAVPGAYTPTCSAAHVPSFVINFDRLKEKGIDTVACVSVNDAFVMKHWGENQNAENLLMLADGSASFTKAVGLELDLTARGMGIRSQRYSMLVKDGVVTQLNIDEPGKYEVSDAETLLSQL
ncbi:peroxiredoxin [Gynuella sunshinyii]|uniref:Glutathione-dependent peroxiredoxin n=1 Tax=Gynuella sunshinyii YC6258 TaxID=1445510 RepID=A0A0C5VEM4_9GAMM|nr:peroxiredoxin [Gynuella sunshinyii]AJQ92651.1 peroxiredoxin [Gynuella sunshinyii YC6258]